MKGWAPKTRFEEEAKGNSEMAYSVPLNQNQHNHFSKSQKTEKIQ